MAPTTSFAALLTLLIPRTPGCMTTPQSLATTLVPSTTNVPCATAPFFPASSSSSTLNHVPHRACPRCLNFLLSRQYNKCPTCAQPHLYFRVLASALPRSILQPASNPSVPVLPTPPVRRRRQPSPPTSTIPLEE